MKEKEIKDERDGRDEKYGEKEVEEESGKNNEMKEEEGAIDSLPTIKERGKTRTTLSVSRAEVVDALAADTTVLNNVYPDYDDDNSGEEVDLEHLPVKDDPREWSWRKKHCVLAVVTYAAISESQSSISYHSK